MDINAWLDCHREPMVIATPFVYIHYGTSGKCYISIRPCITSSDMYLIPARLYGDIYSSGAYLG